jgi:anti-anti-sigma regulatory factor
MSKYRFSEDAGIRNIAAVKNDIIELFDKREDIELDFSDIRRIDLSVGQLLLATMKEGESRSVKVSISGASSEVQKQLAYCGLATLK